jgi:ATP-binding cassette subfamily B multidrug efflux pump
VAASRQTQTLAVNLPMRLRWNFHRLMLSMAFYRDELPGG